MRHPRHTATAFLVTLAATMLGLWAEPARGAESRSSLRNPGFEEEPAPAWQQRTPQDASRKFSRCKTVARSGAWSMAIENLAPVFTRLRQGEDQSIVLAPGSLVELSAWIKPELSDEGEATVQLYCMGDKDSILAQPCSPPVRAQSDWKRARVLVEVPPGARYVMAYLQVNRGTGKAFFDDVELRVVRPPRPLQPAPRIGFLTDLPQDDPCRQNVEVLLGDGLVLLEPGAVHKQLADCAGAVVVARSESAAAADLEAVAQAARQGKPVFMDLGSFARWRKLETAAAKMAGPADPLKPGKPAPSIATRMGAGLRVVKESALTAGFQVGQIVPFAGVDGALLALTRAPDVPDLEVLAVTPDGRPGLVAVRPGKGIVVAADLLSLREPYYAHVDAYYKYLFLARTIRAAEPASPTLGQFYPKKLKYAQFVDLMRQTAAELPAIRFQEEGPACGEYKLYSLNLGRPGAPLYFLYAAAHGSEWEPGYGLLTFARRVAEGRLRDVIDLERVSIKIVPLLNPSGYDLVQRHNAHGVDLNRQGDHRWDAFRGTDSTKDGVYGPKDYDWKGNSPLSEPETKIYRTIAESKNLFCTLDFHGNASATSNRVAVLPATARDDNLERALDLQDRVNRRLRGRWILKQIDQKSFEQYLLKHVYPGGDIPYLMNTSARDRYGLLVELTAGYADSYGTLLQTDVTCEICRALFQAFPIPAQQPR